MAIDTKDIMKQIRDKNLILKSLRHDKSSNKDKIHHIKVELDRLLYSYLKSLKCNCSSLIC